jgi:hypothetical protein
MTATRSVPQRLGDWSEAFDFTRQAITPVEFRTMLAAMLKPAGEDVGDVQAYAVLVQASMTLARLVSANDRTAAIVAAMLTQSGVSRPTITEEGPEA